MFFDALKPFIYAGLRAFYVFCPVCRLSPGSVAAPAFLRRRRVVAALDAADFRESRRRHGVHPRFRPRPRHPPVRTPARRRRPRLALLLNEPGRTHPGNLPAARAGITTQVRLGPPIAYSGKRETGNGQWAMGNGQWETSKNYFYNQWPVALVYWACAGRLP